MPDPDPLIIPDVHTPPDPQRLVAAVEVMSDLRDLFGHAPAFLAHVEELTGLRLGQIRVLHMVGDGVLTIEELAATIGDLPDATRATVESLVDADLLTYAEAAGTGAEVSHLPCDDAEVALAAPAAAELQLTEAGRAQIDRITALHLRHTAEQHDLTEDGPNGGVLTLVRDLSSRRLTPDVAGAAPLPSTA